MSAQGKPRLVWFDANRVFAAFGVVLIHSSTDFAGQPFPEAGVEGRLLPVFFRSIGEFSGSEMFFLFSLFLMALRVDRKMPSYSTAIGQQAKRLLVPFAFWVVFYAFFRLIKAEVFDYTPFIWDQITQLKSWAGYFILGKSQYHMHFLPTLFALFLFYPIMRLATRYPILGLTVFFTLGVMNNTQAFLWSLDVDPVLREYAIRAIKIFGYVGYGLAAFALYGLWNDGIPRGESRLVRRGGLYFAGMAYIATLPFFGYAVETGSWGVRSGWDFYGHFLMPLFIFAVFMGGQYMPWSRKWSEYAKYTFGIYLMHPLFIDLFDIVLYTSNLYQALSPWMIVLLRFLIVFYLSYMAARLLGRVKLLAWTIGLGATPWDLYLSKKKAGV
ncbi:Surface polysaccharide O-acyltransferase, integral membrane enzyme [Monaibacterium marinum]|uniref:Surface polysaccharide O-acyltransferase, integral membrane enzyme n=1 Tax=Pontivivens marinum TaxID=1690039 RepID=A0A2C9CUF1_9RHOB|nr:acyltransferase [Monaibacterium marinum]SOH94843.1 Surface polysaccharide O-acyltransferase, integral membrane enzyme [Monaibacterium marinum]